MKMYRILYIFIQHTISSEFVLKMKLYWNIFSALYCLHYVTTCWSDCI